MERGSKISRLSRRCFSPDNQSCAGLALPHRNISLQSDRRILFSAHIHSESNQPVDPERTVFQLTILTILKVHSCLPKVHKNGIKLSRQQEILVIYSLPVKTARLQVKGFCIPLMENAPLWPLIQPMNSNSENFHRFNLMGKKLESG